MSPYLSGQKLSSIVSTVCLRGSSGQRSNSRVSSNASLIASKLSASPCLIATVSPVIESLWKGFNFSHFFWYLFL